MNKLLVIFSLALFSVTFIQTSFAWQGQLAMDSDARNIDHGDTIHYQGYLYGNDLIDEELVYVKVYELTTEDVIWDLSLNPSVTTVEYFGNTAWTFDFKIDTSEMDISKDMTYVVEAIYDDKTTKLDFFINLNKLEEKVADAGEAFVVAGEKTSEVIVESGSQAGEVIVETGEKAGEVIVETGEKAGEVIVETGEKAGEVIVEKGTEAVEKGAVIGEVVVNKGAETGEVLFEKGSEGIEEINEKGGGCLIATAAYGTELAPQVQFLREIRDNTVMSTASGASFMTGFNQLYYSFSPTIADMERENPIFQEAVRAFITPMISSLSIMTLAENGSEAEVLGLGISVIALNLGMYIAAPAFIGFKVHRHFKTRI